jgi:hypothetical protein
MTFLSIGFFYGQNIEADKRLEAKYSKAELVELTSNNQIKLGFLNYCIDNAFTIMPLPEEKRAASEIRGTIQINDLEEINFFDLGLELEEVNWQYYIIEGTQKMIVIFSKEEIENKMKK